ncbi:MAG: hypothetical protein QOJ62_1512 [Actinomycetota bacterium]|nr:hypothetical protein [Actinomycetota bacterium]
MVGHHRAPRRRVTGRHYVAAVVVVAVLVGASVLGASQFLGANGGSTDEPTEGRATATASRAAPTVGSGGHPSTAAMSAFSAGTVWRAQVASAPLAVNSSTLVGALASQVSSRFGGIAAFNVWRYNTSVYTASASTPLVDVGWDNCQRKPSVPAGLLGAGGQFTGVPIPAGAVPAAGTDAELSVYSPRTDQLWEFWKANHRADGWHACWGGRIDHASTSSGFFAGGFGASASGLAISGGMVSLADVQRGSIDHALALAIVDPAPWKIVSWPAQRSDGSSSSRSPIAEGTRFRLDPTVDVEALALTPVAKMVAKAAQKYGFIVTDKAGAVSVVAESGAGVKATTGTDPWNAIMGSTPSYQIMRNFPWDKLQALPRNYGKP